MMIGKPKVQNSASGSRTNERMRASVSSLSGLGLFIRESFLAGKIPNFSGRGGGAAMPWEEAPHVGP
ncbi:hypothetical protein [Longimicrobium sp.]|uniref:hypothetical protein n=1 Tax=Longimicrobium sp. TaxID=2029185 RepID=UPI003B3BE51E